MNLRPCGCGSQPTLDQCKVGYAYFVQVQCACGSVGPELVFTRPEKGLEMIEMVEKLWNAARESERIS